MVLVVSGEWVVSSLAHQEGLLSRDLGVPLPWTKVMGITGRRVVHEHAGALCT